MADTDNLSDRVKRIAGASAAEMPAYAAAAPAAPRAETRPFAAFEWMIALRYLRARRKESFISVISGFSLAGIALGVGVLIVVMAVMNGFRIELLDRILGLQGHVEVMGEGGRLSGYDAIANRVRAVDGVALAAPIVEGQALASGGGNSPGVIVRGIRASDLKNLTAISKSLPPGALADFRGGDSIVIGVGLAQKLGLRIGDDITLIAPNGNVTPFGTTPRIKTYRVAGTFDIGMSEYNSVYVFLPLAEAQAYFNMDDTVSFIEVMLSNVDDPQAMEDMVTPIQNAVGPGPIVVSWASRSNALADALKIESNVMFLILALIILVAALNIISGMIMLVQDKSSDIAILRTMGAARGTIMRVFFIAGSTIGVVGTLSGLLLGIVFCRYINEIQLFLSWLFHVPLFNSQIYQLTALPEHVETRDVVTVVLMSLALTFLATLYPSWRAARLDPVEALRYE